MKVEWRKAILVMAVAGVSLTSNVVYEYQSKMPVERSIATSDDSPIELVQDGEDTSVKVPGIELVDNEKKGGDKLTDNGDDDLSDDDASADVDDIASNDEGDDEELTLDNLNAKVCEQKQKISDLEKKIEGLLEDKEVVLKKFEKKDSILADMSTLLLYHHLYISRQHRAIMQPYFQNPLSNFQLMGSLLLPYYFQNLAGTQPKAQVQAKDNVLRVPSSKTLGERNFQDSMFNRYTRIVPSFDRGQTGEDFIQL